ncbi:MAG: 4Fe-4S binding protein [Pirellulales bacterium]|nr:4Fe-4S binding protein [Pirellulales bacterium]
MKRLLRIPWRWRRRAAQLAALALLLWLFRRTAYSGEDQLTGGENIFFCFDPLCGAAAMIAARQFIAQFWPALVVVFLTLVLGRFFCGWICPLGTLLDCFHRILRPIARRTNRLSGGAPSRLRPVRYILLIVVLAAAVFSFPLVGLVDPFALLFRGMTFWGDPALHEVAYAGFERLDGRWGAESIEPFVVEHLLPFRANVFRLAGVSAAILASIFALELVARRFWCRYLCPLGAMLGLLGRWSPIKRLPAGTCKSCNRCAELCRMDALSDGLSAEDCTLCMDCVDLCPRGIARFAPRRPSSNPRPVDLSRRGALAGLAVGAAIPALAAAARAFRPREKDPYLLRPPGVDDEDSFLDLCVRCGECMKVCPTGVLQPAVLESGVEGMFSPRLVPRFVFEQTYCELNCTLCGQVCPSGAIPRLSEQAKLARPIGKAYIDHDRCLPWGKETPCIRCEEMCPVPEKAIKILNTYTIVNADGFELEIQQPYVDRELCVGCGICESNCPVEGPSAIRVRRVDAPDPGTETKLEPTRRGPYPFRREG